MALTGMNSLPLDAFCRHGDHDYGLPAGRGIVPVLHAGYCKPGTV